MTPHAILLIPAEGSELLREGPCGARPPTVLLCRTDERNRPGVPGSWHLATVPCREHPRTLALVLVWEGADVWQGMEVCARLDVPVPNTCLTAADVRHAIQAARRSDWDRDWVERIRVTASPLGTVLLLDANGREIQP